MQNRQVSGRGRLIASTYDGTGEGFSLRRLYLETNVETTPASGRADHHAALAALLTAAIGENGEALTGSQVQKLNNLLAGIEAHLVTAPDSLEDIVKAAKALA